MKIIKTLKALHIPLGKFLASIPIASFAIFALLLSSCGKKNDSTQIAVFAPGILADSPIYSMMADGVRLAADEWNDNGKNKPCAVTISEAGTNQAQWGPLLTALAASGKYDLIISSNPSLPSLVLPITKQFPNQKFILLDAKMQGCDSVSSCRFDQEAQSYFAGYAAAFLSKSGRIALIAAQEYPVMNDIILPGYEAGALAANPAAAIDFRVVGNWYDAAKGAEIARALSDAGADVILPIAGGAGQGVIAAARERNMRLVLFDSADFNKAPDIIAASSVVEQERIAYEMTNAFLSGSIKWGESKMLTAKDGYVRIVLSEDANLVSKEMREKVNEMASNK